MRKSVYTAEYTTLRTALQACRAQAGLSQRQLAQRLKVPHSWVAKVESGERRIDLIEFGWFLAACGADPLPVLKRVLQQFSGVPNTARTQGRPLIMSLAADDHRRRLLMAAFQMPSVQTMVSRKSSITNAFVSAIIPVIVPTHEEIEESLRILGMEPPDVRCAFCGDRASEWDHLRPLVLQRRPTGFISEIANLVPACGKCNQSKGNKPWRDWMRSAAKLSPTGRGLAGVADRIARLEAYERWRVPTRVDFEAVLGRDGWEHYWSLCEAVIEQLRQCQQVADSLRVKIGESLKA